MTDKFSGIFKAELPVLIERRFCKASYSLAAVFNVCVMKIKCENMLFCELLPFRIFTHCCFSPLRKAPPLFLPVFAVSHFPLSLLSPLASKHLHLIPLLPSSTAFLPHWNSLLLFSKCDHLWTFLNRKCCQTGSV